MSVSVNFGDFDSIRSLPEDSQRELSWSHVFTTPAFMRSWHESFRPESEVYLGIAEEGGRPIGLAPLLIDGPTASFIGDAEVCDYFDFSIVPGKETVFFTVLLEDLFERGVRELDLRCLRPEASVLSDLRPLVLDRGGTFDLEPDGVSLEVELPGDWESYLGLLKGKQRHEVRRKIRRLENSADHRLRTLQDPAEVRAEMDGFLEMFRISRTDKAAFMDQRMETFFRTLLLNLAEEGLLRLFFLELDGRNAAACICFDYHDRILLYNSGYDPEFRDLSAGLLCKVFSLGRTIEMGRKVFDFLKGAEPYKARLGAEEVRLSRARIILGGGGREPENS